MLLTSDSPMCQDVQHKTEPESDDLLSPAVATANNQAIASLAGKPADDGYPVSARL
jgi:hypothetical protein